MWKPASIARDQPSQRSAASIPVQNLALYGVLEGTLVTPLYHVPCSDRVEVEGDAPLDARRNAQ